MYYLNKLIKSASVLAIALGLIVGAGEQSASAASPVMWGKTELKDGQIGKVTVLADTKLVKLEKDGTLSTVRAMKRGEEYRVYSYKGQRRGMYGVGASSFVLKDSKVKYETPSKSKLALLEQNKDDFGLNKQYAYEYMGQLMETQILYRDIVDYNNELLETAEVEISWSEYQSIVRSELLPGFDQLIQNAKKINPKSAETKEINLLYIQILVMERESLDMLSLHDLKYWNDEGNSLELKAKLKKVSQQSDLFQRKTSSFYEKYGIKFSEK